uniref:Uncharacterized protein n=1 Tax=Arundo donax TaxID=35708 RepID=A0A0A9B036_ARUDO
MKEPGILKKFRKLSKPTSPKVEVHQQSDDHFYNSPHEFQNWKEQEKPHEAPFSREQSFLRITSAGHL